MDDSFAEKLRKLRGCANRISQEARGVPQQPVGNVTQRQTYAALQKMAREMDTGLREAADLIQELAERLAP